MITNTLTSSATFSNTDTDMGLYNNPAPQRLVLTGPCLLFRAFSLEKREEEKNDNVS